MEKFLGLGSGGAIIAELLAETKIGRLIDKHPCTSLMLVHPPPGFKKEKLNVLKIDKNHLRCGFQHMRIGTDRYILMSAHTLCYVLWRIHEPLLNV